MDDGWRRILRDVVIALLGAFAVAWVVARVHADLSTVLAAGTGACLLVLAVLEGPALVRKRRLRASARAGFHLEPDIQDKWIYLGVTNDSGQVAEFGASVEAVEPAPPGKHERSWPVPWSETLEERQVIDPHGTRYLQLGYGEITPVEGDRQLAGNVSFRCAGRGDVSFNYENADEFARRAPAIKVTVRVYRVSPRLDVTFKFLVGLRFGDGEERALPWIEPVSQYRNGDRPSWYGPVRERSAARMRPKSSDADCAAIGRPSGAPNAQKRREYPPYVTAQPEHLASMVSASPCRCPSQASGRRLTGIVPRSGSRCLHGLPRGLGPP